MQKTLSDLDNRRILVAPSVLAADFACLGDEIKRVEDAGADIIHLDIMDGHFVPNLTFGPPIVSKLRPMTGLPFDVHLMLTNPKAFVKPFADAGADHITFHIECDDDIESTICEIRSCGCSVGLTVKPGTSPEPVLPWLPQIDLILVMTVEPGFGGQSFMSGMMPKVRMLRDAISACGRNIHLEVDGGIDAETVSIVADHGANMLVAGTSVFRNPVGAESAIMGLHNAQAILDDALAG